MERVAAPKAREALTVQMTDGHRQELERLEFLVEGIRENTRRHGGTVKLALDEHLGLGRLTTSYVQLAISYREKTTSLAMLDRQRLLENIETLQYALSRINATDHPWPPNAPPGRAPAVHRAAPPRALGPHARAAGGIAHQLATITELIQFLHAQSMAASSGPRRSATRSTASWQSSARTR